MVIVAQLVRVPDCGSGGRGFEPRLSPRENPEHFYVWGFLFLDMFYVYIRKSQKNGSFYIGQTNDFNARLKRHNAGENKSTKAYLPWIEILVLSKNSRSEAMILEKKIKNLSHKRLLDFINKYSR